MNSGTGLLGQSLQSLRTNWLRTSLTLLGIVIGVGSVIVMTAIGRGSQRQVAESLGALGDNVLIVSSGGYNSGGVSLGAGSAQSLKARDIEMLGREVRSASAMSPVVRTAGHIVGGSGNWAALVQGVSADFAQIRSWTLSSGAFFGQREMQARAPVAVLGVTVANRLFPDREATGARIRINNVPFTILGVLDSKGASTFGGDQDDAVFVPWTTAQARLSGRQEVGEILLMATDSASLGRLEDEIRTVLRRAHRLSSAAEDDFTIRAQTQIVNVVSETSRVMTLLLASVAAISLLVGGIGIMNMMLVAVTERTREIGLRVALGARQRDVLAQFLFESVVICLAGGALGAGMGVLICWVLESFMDIRALIEPDMLLLALAFAALVGLFFGIYPARQAARLDPIEALRSD